MKWRLHHVNIPVFNIRETAKFYTETFDMEEYDFPFVKEGDGGGKMNKGGDHVAFFEDGTTQIHMCRPTREMSYDNHMCLHPVLNGHHAIQVDDIEEVKERLRRQKVPFDDAGQWAFAGHYQIYFYDPAMNVVEVNQRIK
jgi:catechol 2,3-dioxygenase-like lactoylglutathione lyase family enzyme